MSEVPPECAPSVHVLVVVLGGPEGCFSGSSGDPILVEDVLVDVPIDGFTRLRCMLGDGNCALTSLAAAQSDFVYLKTTWPQDYNLESLLLDEGTCECGGGTLATNTEQAIICAVI